MPSLTVNLRRVEVTLNGCAVHNGDAQQDKPDSELPATEPNGRRVPHVVSEVRQCDGEQSGA